MGPTTARTASSLASGASRHIATNARARASSGLRLVSRSNLETSLGTRNGAESPRTFLTIIQQGHEGWRLRLGRDPVQLSPGLNIAIPLYHQVMVVDMRESSISIPKLPGYTSDNVPVVCSGSLFYKVTDGYKACFEVSNVHENIKNTGTSAMRSVLGMFTYDQVIGDRNELNKRLNTVIGTSIQNWGVECTRFEIQSFQPANREVERQLELQMEAERNRRKQLLDTQAQINVAEGTKQKVILESEGLLTAKSNEADASYKTVVREAEARQQQALMEASAIAQQVDLISKSIASSRNPSSSSEHTEPTLEDKRLALSTLVELKRLEQLKAIARGQGNSTYFFGEKAVMGQGSGEAYNVDYAEQVKKGLVPPGSVPRAPSETARPVEAGGTFAASGPGIIV
ncbi:Synaptotagmin-like protein 2 [Stygiomarasmius scandens]|uniref:Synaptotagmin-like protein 2 n=1 Tax=Marasmiellus scandens TaxID=2682957 RepID=A0ABR1JE29_9AGAR